jgi:tetratricopeptide (TPR) repeat protein
MRNLSHALVDSGAIEPGLAFMEEAAAADPWPLGLLLDLAEMKVKSKHAKGLDQLCDQARAIVPEDSDALFDFGRLCGIAGRLDEAERVIRRSLALDLKRAYSHQSRGEKYSYLSEILARDGRFEEAIAAGRQAVDDNPRSAAYAARLGVLYARAKRNGEAADWYRRALMLDPGNVENTAKLNGLLRLV